MADIPFDPASVSPSPLPLAHLSLSFFCLCSLFLVSCHYLPLHPSAFLPFLVSSLVVVIFPSVTSLSASPLLLIVCVCLVCCVVVLSCPVWRRFPRCPELNSCKGHICTQMDAHRGPEDNTQPENHRHTCFARSHLQLVMQHYCM